MDEQARQAFLDELDYAIYHANIAEDAATYLYTDFYTDTLARDNRDAIKSAMRQLEQASMSLRYLQDRLREEWEEGATDN